MSDNKLNNTTVDKKHTKYWTAISDVQLIMSRVKNGINSDQATELAQSYIEWAKQDEAWDIIQFCSAISIPRSTWYYWCNQHPELKQASEMVKDLIAERRQRKMTFKEYNVDSKVVMNTMRLYHHDWKETYDEDQAHKKEQSAATELLEFFKGKSVELPDMNEQSED